MLSCSKLCTDLYKIRDIKPDACEVGKTGTQRALDRVCYVHCATHLAGIAVVALEGLTSKFMLSAVLGEASWRCKITAGAAPIGAPPLPQFALQCALTAH